MAGLSYKSERNTRFLAYRSKRGIAGFFSHRELGLSAGHRIVCFSVLSFNYICRDFVFALALT